MSLLSVRSLTVHIPRGPLVTRAVENLSFDINRGEVFGLVGESGCGKSMTALAVMGLLPTAARIVKGEIVFENKNLVGQPDSVLRTIRGNRVAMIFQEPMTSLNPVFTVGFQIAELLMTHKGLSKRAGMDMAVDLLGKVKVPSPELRVHQYPHQMSGGMRQRVMIAMALACEPAFIIADEPTTALDVTIQAQILELLEELRESTGTSMLFITHDLGLVSEISDRLTVMYAGAAMEQSEASRVFSRPGHPYTRGLLDSLPVERGRRLRPIPGTVPTAENFPPGCRFSPRCAFRIEACDKAEPELRELQAGHWIRCIRAEEIARA